MIDTNALRGAIVAKGMTQEQMAKDIGIAPQTFYRKMKKGVFGSDEIEIMVKTLDIDDPAKIFFANTVS